ncbi:hypothetical protein ACFS07_00960 [Undibacterium arcticum]
MFIGSGAIVALLLVFKPMLSGLLRAVKLVFNPRLSKEERTARRHQRDAMTIHRVASAYDKLQPNLAAELRALASRG